MCCERVASYTHLEAGPSDGIFRTPGPIEYDVLSGFCGLHPTALTTTHATEGVRLLVAESFPLPRRPSERCLLSKEPTFPWDQAVPLSGSRSVPFSAAEAQVLWEFSKLPGADGVPVPGTPGRQ